MKNRMKTAVAFACLLGALVGMNQLAEAKDNVRFVATREDRRARQLSKRLADSRYSSRATPADALM
jgi:hypothetical protein